MTPVDDGLAPLRGSLLGGDRPPHRVGESLAFERGRPLNPLATERLTVHRSKPGDRPHLLCV